MIEMSLQFFGGRGSSGGNKVAENSEAPAKEAIEKPIAPKVDKVKAWEEKATKLKSEMTQSQFTKKWSSLLKNAPVGTTFILEGSDWENSRENKIIIEKESNKTVGIRWTDDIYLQDKPVKKDISYLNNLKTNDFRGNILENYNVDKIRIKVRNNKANGGSRAIKEIDLKRG